MNLLTITFYPKDPVTVTHPFDLQRALWDGGRRPRADEHDVVRFWEVQAVQQLQHAPVQGHGVETGQPLTALLTQGRGIVPRVRSLQQLTAQQRDSLETCRLPSAIDRTTKRL